MSYPLRTVNNKVILFETVFLILEEGGDVIYGVTSLTLSVELHIMG